MAQQFLADKYIFNDPSGRTNLYSSGNALYYADELIWPTGLYGINTNELIIVSIDLASGCTEQQIIFPNNYQSIPKIVYSIYGLNQEDVLGSHISEITSGYAIIRFTHPVPNDQYNIQLFMFRNDTYKTVSGTTYDFNAILRLDTRYLDSYYGWDSQGVPDRMAFPYRTITGTESWAGESGVTMYLEKGDFDGGDIAYGNTSIVFAPNSRITSPLGVGNGKTLNLYNGRISITGASSSGISLGSGATLNLYGETFVELASDTSSKYAIQGNNGTVNVFGNLYYNRPISSKLNIMKDGGVTGYDIIVDSNISQTLYGNEVSGVNRNIIFSNLASGLNHGLVTHGQRVTVKSGSYAGGFTISKDVDILFEKGALLNSSATISSDVRLRDINIASADSGINILSNKTVIFDGNGNISATNQAITGNGVAKCIGRLSYNAPVSPSIRFDEEPEYVGIVSPLYPSSVSGFNGTYRMSSFQSVVNLAPTGSRIFVDAGTYSGVTISGKNGLVIDFDENSMIMSPMVLAGHQKVVLNSCYFDAGSDVSIDHAIEIRDNSTGIFLKDGKIRIPHYYSIYYVTGTAPNTGVIYTTGLSVIGYTGTFFSTQISGNGISGWFYRAGGDHTGTFVHSIDGVGITGSYASASGYFNGNVNYNIPNAIFKYSSGASQYYSTGTLNGIGVTGFWYSGMCYGWTDLVTGSTYIIGYKFPTGGGDVNIYWDLGINEAGRSGFYWSGSNGTFTDSVSGCNITGRYASGASQTGGYFETSYGPEPFVTGYYFSGGLSGYYISGGTGALTGILSSGLRLNTRYSASGNGAVSMQGSLYNQLIDPSVTNLLGDTTNYNTGKLFDPWGIVYA